MLEEIQILLEIQVTKLTSPTSLQSHFKFSTYTTEYSPVQAFSTQLLSIMQLMINQAVKHASLNNRHQPRYDSALNFHCLSSNSTTQSTVLINSETETLPLQLMSLVGKKLRRLSMV